jgi:hypothetical protein
MDAYYAEQRRQAEAYARERWQAMQRMRPPMGPGMLPPPSPYAGQGPWAPPQMPSYPSAPQAPSSR